MHKCPWDMLQAATHLEVLVIKKNECSELPENVKLMAEDHCDKNDTKAVFLGNKKNLLQMTVSVFRCE
ncbi:hypothetical protein N9K90_03260 [Gammaproteobacteria bacterium]|nr:hypothetical protein [Gammaproteobacteria bacterium]